MENKVCLDLFITPINNEKIEIATFATVSSITGGEIHLFQEFE